MSNESVDRLLRKGRIGFWLLVVAAVLQTSVFISKWIEGKHTMFDAAAVVNSCLLCWWAWGVARKNEKIAREIMENGGDADIEKGNMCKRDEKEKAGWGVITEEGKQSSEVTTAEIEEEALKEEAKTKEKVELEI
ncbi:hypothetical protein GT037_002676 [Alternaria burnsii]|uniref:Uncharacterized protein n=1 Tax=Alternaria burnsii TaxID=1187904 RepID=A0A8H7B775_9PLEO|nr:uncharacterized protein GT037_002676 [Alternaria burnsii]KAF7678928.1 hypothetical protein GT037_002676 [Alternaria burnsii]